MILTLRQYNVNWEIKTGKSATGTRKMFLCQHLLRICPTAKPDRSHSLPDHHSVEKA